MTHCTFEQSWERPRGPLKDPNICNPHLAQHDRFPDAARLRSYLSDNPDGIGVCLKLSWGQPGAEQGVSRLAWLKSDGSLYMRDGTQRKAPQIVLPKASEKQSLRFRLYVFASEYQGDKQAYCKDTMGQAQYSCLSDGEKKACLSYFEFRPASRQELATVSLDGSSCKLHFRAPGATEPREVPDAGTEPRSNEPRSESRGDEPDAPALDAPTKESAKEALPKEPSPPEPREPATDEAPQPREPVASDGGESPHESPPEPRMPREGTPAECTPGKCSSWLRVAGGSGSSQDYAFDVVENPNNGDIYIVGGVVSNGFKIDLARPPKTFGGLDILVACLDARGRWKWAQIAGSTGTDFGFAVALDSKNKKLYVVGNYGGKASFGPKLSLGAPKQSDSFVAQLELDGTWNWVARGIARDLSYLNNVAVGPDGYVYVAGLFSGNLTLGSLPPHLNMSNTAHFVARLTDKGAWNWSVAFDPKIKMGVHPILRFQAPLLALSPSHRLLYLAGEFGPGGKVGPFTPITTGNRAYITALELSKTAPQTAPPKWINWMQQGQGFNNASDLAIDSKGRAVVLGVYGGNLKLSSSKPDITLGPSSKTGTPFIATLDPKGDWHWGKGLGTGSILCGVSSLALDAKDNIYVAGNLQTTCIFGNNVTLNAAGAAVFIAKLDHTQTWRWAVKGGGPYPNQPLSGDDSKAIFASPSGTVISVGNLQSPQFGAYSTTSPYTDHQLFVAKDVYK